MPLNKSWHEYNESLIDLGRYEPFGGERLMEVFKRTNVNVKEVESLVFLVYYMSYLRH